MSRAVPVTTTWFCAACGGEMIGAEPSSGCCRRCQLENRSTWRPGVTLDHRSVNRVPVEHRSSCAREAVLRASGFGPGYCKSFEEKHLPGGRWPRDKRKPRVTLAEWCGESSNHLVLIKGAVGTGKTFLAVQLAYQAWLAGASIGYVMAGDIATLRWQRRDSRLLTLGALVVDDLDRGPSGAAWNPTFEVIHNREISARPVIATMNSTMVQLYELHAALCDRFRRGLVVSMEGKSQR